MNYNQPIQQSPKTALKTIKIIHIALLLGQVMFAAVTFSISNKSISFGTKGKSDNIFFVLVPLLAIVSFAAGTFIFKKLVSGLSVKNTLSEKLMGYQAALIVRYALLEGASLFGIVVFMLTNNLLFLLIAVGIMLFFFTLRPTVDKVADDLQLNYDEKAAL